MGRWPPWADTVQDSTTTVLSWGLGWRIVGVRHRLIARAKQRRRLKEGRAPAMTQAGSFTLRHAHPATPLGSRGQERSSLSTTQQLAR